ANHAESELVHARRHEGLAKDRALLAEEWSRGMEAERDQAVADRDEMCMTRQLQEDEAEILRGRLATAEGALEMIVDADAARMVHESGRLYAEIAHAREALA